MKMLPYNIYYGQNDSNSLNRISLHEFKEVVGDTLTKMLSVTNILVEKYAIRREADHEIVHLWCVYREDTAQCTNCGAVVTKANPIETISILHSNMWGKQTFLHFLSRRFECEQCGITFCEDKYI